MRKIFARLLPLSFMFLLPLYPASAATKSLLTAIYCDYAGGDSGIPEGAYCQWLNVKEGDSYVRMLNFGEATPAEEADQTLLGARIDNVAGETFNSISFVAHGWSSKLSNQLILYLNAKTASGPVYAYAYASHPTKKTTLANGDIQLTFASSAFTTFPGGTALPAKATIVNLQVATTDGPAYSAVSYYLYNVLVNGVTTTPNVKAAVSDCTF